MCKKVQKLCGECEKPSKKFFDGLCPECAVHETVLCLMTPKEKALYFNFDVPMGEYTQDQIDARNR